MRTLWFQTHRELQPLRWVSSLPWPSAAAGAVPAGTNIIGPKTLGLVLQDFHESGLSSTDSAPQEHPGSHRTLCERLP